VLASDYAERYKVGLPAFSHRLMEELDRFLPPIWNRANPMDIIGDGGAERYARVFDTLLRFPDEWDIAVVIAVPSAVINPGDLAREMVRFSESSRKITIGCFIGGDSMKEGIRILRSHHIPNYDDIDSAFRALGRSISGHKHR
jgi:acyl-CoA synthetase (NDP forming)